MLAHTCKSVLKQLRQEDLHKMVPTLSYSLDYTVASYLRGAGCVEAQLIY